MDFSTVKSITIPEGTAKELRIDGVYVWEKPSNYSVLIMTDNASPVTDFYIKDEDSKTFTAEYNVPSSQASLTPVWTISGLPSGLSAQSLNGDSLTISGVAASTGDYAVTIGVTKGSYSDSKEYTFKVTDKGYVSLSENFYSSYMRGYRDELTLPLNRDTGSVTRLSVSCCMPSTEKNTKYEWEIEGLPLGLDTEFRYNESDVIYIIGYPTEAGTYPVTVTVKRGSYSDSKNYTFTVSSDGYGVEITDTNIPNFYGGVPFSGGILATANVPSGSGALTYHAINLPEWLNLDSETGYLWGTPPEVNNDNPYNTGDNYVCFYLYAECYPYRSNLLTINDYIQSPTPSFDEDEITIEIDADDVRNSSMVGEDVVAERITGNLLKDVDDDNDTVRILIDGHTLPYTIVPVKAASGTTTAPKIEIRCEDVNYVLAPEYAGRIFMFYGKLTTRTTTNSATLRKRPTTSHTLTLTNKYGTASITINMKFV